MCFMGFKAEVLKVTESVRQEDPDGYNPTMNTNYMRLAVQAYAKDIAKELGLED